MLEIRVLGPLQVCRDGHPVALPGAASRRVLAALALRGGRWVSVDRLTDDVWGERRPASARKALQMHVSRLRRAFDASGPVGEGVLETGTAGYRLQLAPEQLDAMRFERAVERGRRWLEESEPLQARDQLSGALELWRGAPLAELSLEAGLAVEIARLEDLRVAALELRISADLALGRHAEVIGELQRLVVEHPWHERLHTHLMLALYRVGRQADALEAYRRARGVLVEQLGIEPGPELRSVQQALLRQDPELEQSFTAWGAEGVHGRDRGAHATPLLRVPVPPSVTVGRDADEARLRDTLAAPSARLVTVVGPGGVGKTRLAIEVARAVGLDYRDGACFVSLAAIESHEDVAAAVVQRLAVSRGEMESAAEALSRHLRARELLLVLDNFEHVVAAASLVAELLAVCPGLRVIATSRAPLHIRAERLYRLEPLELPAQAYDDTSPGGRPAAVELFAAVAQAREPGFRLTQGNLATVCELCRALDGLPLAIELAASRLAVLSVSEIAERLRHGLEVLSASTRDAATHQRTLTATLEWSHRLLSPAEQTAFAALAVFAGGCTLAAAQAITRAPLDVIEALAVNNLLTVQTDQDRPRRLAMLETVREFARTRQCYLAQVQALGRRHCEYYLTVAERAQPEIRRSHSAALLSDLDLEVHNLRAALRWAISLPEPSYALRLATALGMYWRARSHYAEEARWLASALAVSDDSVAATVRAQALAAYASSFVLHEVARPDTFQRAEAIAHESLDLHRSAGDLAGEAVSLKSLAFISLQHDRTQDAYGFAHEAEQLARRADDELMRLEAVHIMAGVAPTITEALALGQQARNAYRSAGNRRKLSQLASSLAYAALSLGEDRVARQLSQEAVEVAADLGDPIIEAYACGNHGLAALMDGDSSVAWSAFARELHLVTSHSYPKLLFESLAGLAATAAARGDDELAAELAGAATATGSDRHSPAITERLEERFFGPSRDRLGATCWNTAFAAGTHLDHTALTFGE